MAHTATADPTAVLGAVLTASTRVDRGGGLMVTTIMAITTTRVRTLDPAHFHTEGKDPY